MVMKFNGGGMNMEKYKQTYSLVSKTEMSEIEQTVVKQQLKPTTQRQNNANSNHLSRIHGKQASLQYWESMQKLPNKKLFPYVNKNNSQRDKQNSGDQQKRVMTSINYDDEHIIAYKSQSVDPYMRRTLSQQTKKDFMKFLLVQKAAQNNDGKLLREIKEQTEMEMKSNYSSRMNKVQLQKKRGMISKKMISYLQKKEENEDCIKRQINSIFQYKSHQNEIIEQELPLDEYIQQIAQKRGNQKLENKLVA